MAFACTIFMAEAQDTIPNGNFEFWSSTSYMLPTNYPASSNQEALQKNNTVNVTQTTDAYHGQYAIQLTTLAPAGTNTNPVGGWIANSSTPGNGDPTTWPGGIPYNQMPTGFTGFYQYNVNSGDSALVGVVFKKNGQSYAHYFYALGGIHSTYYRFSFTFTPALTQAPDSIIFVATSSNLLKNNGVAGSTVKFDSISFTGASQPAVMNGDFENWANHTSTPILTEWIVSGDSSSVLQTTDSKIGTYALELKTVAGTDNNNNFQLNTGNVQDGVWNNNTNTFSGGFPYAHTEGTLTFWYKYAPANPHDSAMVNISLKKEGVIIGGYGIKLNAVANYTYVEMPFSTNGTTSDSAMINIGSSYWQSQTWADTAKSYVGAVLKIDGLAFKTTSTGVNTNSMDKNIIFYPNPMKETGIFHISSQINLAEMKLLIYNASGAIVKRIPVTSNILTLSKRDFLPGIYYYEFSQGNVSIKKGKIIVE